MATPKPAIWAAVWWTATAAVWGTEGEPGVLWQVSVEGNVNGSAVIDWHGRVYFGTANESATEPSGVFYCVDKSGGVKWSRPFDEWLVAAPAVTPSRVYVGCNDNRLYCLDKYTGEPLWTHDTSGRVDVTPAVDTRGRVYFGSRDRWMRCVRPDGGLEWSTFLFGPIASSALIDERTGRLYVADLSNTVYALALADGRELWRYKPRQVVIEGVRLRMYSSPGLHEGFLFLGSGDFHIYAVNAANGQLFWKEPTEGIVDSSPVVSLENRIYLANRAGQLYGLDPWRPEGQRILWETEVGQVFYGSPTVDAAGNVYICGAPPVPPNGDPATRLSYVDGVTGEVLWHVDVDGYTDATPLLDAAGDVYFGTSANVFVKVRGQGERLADSNWPTFHGGAAMLGRYGESFSRWLASFGLSGTQLEMQADSDGDGRDDFAEFVQGGDPTVPDTAPYGPEIVGSAERESGARYRVYLPIGIRASYRLENSSDFRQWETFLPNPEALAFERLDLWWRVSAPAETAGGIGLQTFRTHWDWRSDEALAIPPGSEQPPSPDSSGSFSHPLPGEDGNAFTDREDAEGFFRRGPRRDLREEW